MRTGKPAEQWDKALGKSLDRLPSTYLPTKRLVLQRYRSLRIEKPDAPTTDLATTIAAEIKGILDKARVPTIPPSGCNKRVKEVVEMWNKHNKRPEKRLTSEFQNRLDSLADLAPKPSGRGGNKERDLEHIRNLMKESGKTKKRGFMKDDSESDWEDDFNFYVDQYEVQVLILYSNTFSIIALPLDVVVD